MSTTMVFLAGFGTGFAFLMAVIVIGAVRESRYWRD